MFDILYTILPILAWGACACLFSVPGIWGGFFTFSLLGHISQAAPGSGNKRES